MVNNLSLSEDTTQETLFALAGENMKIINIAMRIFATYDCIQTPSVTTFDRKRTVVHYCSTDNLFVFVITFLIHFIYVL